MLKQKIRERKGGKEGKDGTGQEEKRDDTKKKRKSNFKK